MLTDVLIRVVAVVGILLPVAVATFVGRRRLATLQMEWRSRFRESGPLLVVLLVVLGINRVMRQEGPTISDAIGIQLTWLFYELEGEFVLVFQSVASPELTAYFSAIYVYGYAFLLIFPGIAYFALSNTIYFRQLLAAYSLNYTIGLVFYLVVIALGPRNVMPDLLAGTMVYDASPEYHHFTRQLNSSTNVFPSLHTSLSVTVAIFAYRTREQYPRWTPVAVVIALSVVISTMYLGFHWVIDVVAGIALAAGCVALSMALVDSRNAG
ncbi:phosphatase PAP2 family protein [Natronobacterium gregoryi]|uniref:Inositol phosphorylceramide synthase n=2 Tax=Natronobacterium gregoryi TaxID=44930 RepID=L0AD84_NATGS|nr:phosphatase PAP2 family protein [Natronobacterium gregoryi]AFZ71868.1 PAP2 superfamily protein [Natronobacterium gregoryi SP2]ELY73062.1 PA-phosphatase-like phosphoesterase [Natronobacterium gregoryi SP2]PLK19384.1 inositol phosphorylceramide synthase [Natronobacterium gregoryi SP2]SFJ50744.1 PAP2 superfamily protein [Natronobacterium gregoryi]